MLSCNIQQQDTVLTTVSLLLFFYHSHFLFHFVFEKKTNNNNLPSKIIAKAWSPTNKQNCSTICSAFYTRGPVVRIPSSAIFIDHFCLLLRNYEDGR